MPKELSLEELKNRYQHYLTVRKLLEFIVENNIPLDAKILVQRVEDVYFEKHGWDVLKKKGETWHSCKKWNDEVDSGRFLNKEDYPDLNPEQLQKFTDEQLEEAKAQYHPAWSPVAYRDDKYNLYLDLHY